MKKMLNALPHNLSWGQIQLVGYLNEANEVCIPMSFVYDYFGVGEANGDTLMNAEKIIRKFLGEKDKVTIVFPHVVGSKPTICVTVAVFNRLVIELERAGYQKAVEFKQYLFTLALEAGARRVL